MIQEPPPRNHPGLGLWEVGNRRGAETAEGVAGGCDSCELLRILCQRPSNRLDRSTGPATGPSAHEFPQVFRQEVMKALPGYYVFFDEGALHVPGPVEVDGRTMMFFKSHVGWVFVCPDPMLSTSINHIKSKSIQYHQCHHIFGWLIGKDGLKPESNIDHLSHSLQVTIRGMQ